MDYSWVAEKRIEAMRQKLKRRGLPDYKQRPISERYGVAYTGLGPDGQLDVSAPVGMENGTMYHEGEMRGKFPEGSIALDARTTSMAYPETQGDQARMKMYEKSGNLPGFQTGGARLDINRGVPNGPATSVPNTAMVTPVTERLPGSAIQTQPIQTQPPTQMSVKAPVNTMPTIEPFKVNLKQPTETTITPPVARLEGSQATPTIPKEIPKTGNPYNPGSKEYAYWEEANQPKGEQMTVPPQNAPVTEPIKTGPIVPAEEPTPGQPAISGTAADRISAEDAARNAGLEYMQGTLTGENKAAMLEGQRAVADLASRQQQEISALRQQYLQQGMSGPAIESLIQQRRNSQEGELNDLAAQYGIAGMQARERTAEALASQGLAGQQFEEDVRRYGNTEGWRAYEAAIAAGDFETAAERYKDVTGKDISMDQMQTYQDYMNRKQEQDIEAGDISLQSARNKLGDETYQSVQDMINGGSSLSAVNARLAEQGKEPITSSEYQGMLEATPLGERNWGRNLAAANMLLTTPGSQSKLKAEALYTELFPGVDFAGIFDKVISEEKYENFADGLSKMAEYVASGLKFEEAYGLLAAGGAADKMGVTASQLRFLYNNLNVNAVDAEWEEMESSDFYNSLDEEDQNGLREFFKQRMLGELDYTMLHEYEVYNPDGTLNMTIYGKTSDEADKKATSLGSGYTVKDTGKVKFQMASTLTGGTVTTGNEPSPSLEGTRSDKPVGTRYLEDGRAYEVGAGGEIKELKINAAEEAWSKMGDDLLKLGTDGNPYYRGIIEARAKSVIDGTHDIGKTITDEALYNEIKNQLTEYVPQTKVTTKGEQKWTYIGNVPENGSIISFGGKLYKVVSDKEVATAASPTDSFRVLDFTDGSVRVAVTGGDGKFKIM